MTEKTIYVADSGAEYEDYFAAFEDDIAFNFKDMIKAVKFYDIAGFEIGWQYSDDAWYYDTDECNNGERLADFFGKLYEYNGFSGKDPGVKVWDEQWSEWIDWDGIPLTIVTDDWGIDRLATDEMDDR